MLVSESSFGNTPAVTGWLPGGKDALEVTKHKKNEQAE